MDGATLWLGVAGVVLGTISLTWQAVTFRLTGSRVIAHLRVGTRTPAGAAISQRADKDWRRHLNDLVSEHYGTPVLVLEAANVGRMAVGVEQVIAVVEGGYRLTEFAPFNSLGRQKAVGGQDRGVAVSPSLAVPLDGSSGSHRAVVGRV